MRAVLFSVFITSYLFSNASAFADDSNDRLQGTSKAREDIYDCHDGFCATIGAFDALLRSASAAGSRPEVKHPNALTVHCKSKTKDSDLSFSCPNMKISWLRTGWKEAKYQNFKDGGVKIDLEPSHTYEVVLETIDGKWSRKFSQVKAGDLIQVLVNR